SVDISLELSRPGGLSLRNSTAIPSLYAKERFDDWPEDGQSTEVMLEPTGSIESNIGRYRTINRNILLRRGYSLGYRVLWYFVEPDGANREDVYTGQFLFGPEGEIHILPFRGRFSLYAGIALLNRIDGRLNRVINDKRFPPGIGEEFLERRNEAPDLHITVGMRWQPVVPLYLLGENAGERLAGIVPGIGSSGATSTTVVGTGWRDIFSLRMSLGGEVSAGGITMGDGSEMWMIYSSLIVDILNNHSLRFNSGGGDAGRVDTVIPAEVFGTELSPNQDHTFVRSLGLEYAYGVPILESLSASAGLRAQILEQDFPGYNDFSDRISDEERPRWDVGEDLFVITRYYTAGPSVRLAWLPGRFWMELGAGYQHVLATRRAYAKYVKDGRDRIRFDDPDGFFLVSLGLGLRL
ncbi:MAG: hypothetical protein EA427_16040, partial [Spirochaetaceae bacterium]